MVQYLYNANDVHIGIKSTSNRPKDFIEKKLGIYYTDSLEFYDKIRESGFDVIINAVVDYGFNRDNRQLRFSNVILPSKVLDYSSSEKLLFINFDSFYTKFHDYPRLKLYQESKIELKKIFSLAQNVRVINFQLEHLYGPHDRIEKFIPQISLKLKNNIKKISLTSGVQKRDFLFIDDLLRLITKVIEDVSIIPFGFNHFEVGTGSSIMLKSFLKELKYQLGSGSYLDFGKLQMSKFEIMDSKANLDELKKIFQWEPSYTYSMGIKKLIETDKRFR